MTPFGLTAAQLDALRRRWARTARRSLTDSFGARGFSVEDPGGAAAISISGADGTTARLTPGDGTITLDSPAGRRWRFALDDRGQVREIVDALGHAVRFDRADDGRLAAVVTADGCRYAFDYDDAGRAREIGFPDGTTHLLDYDAAGRLVAERDRAGGITTYGRADGRLVVIRDRSGRETRFEQGGGPGPAIVRPPAGPAHQYRYAPGGSLAEASVGPETITFTEPAPGMRRLDYGDGDTLLLTLADDRVVEARDGSGMVRRRYDTAGRLTREESGDRAVALERDGAGRLVALRLAGEAPVTVERDADGLATAVVDWTGRRYRLSYDARGALAGLRWPNRVTLAQTTTGDGRTATMRLAGATPGAAPLLDLRLARDAAGRLAEQAETGAATRRYRYGPGGRLVAETVGEATRDFVLDGAGNRLDGDGVRCAFDAADRLIERNGRPVRQDAAGRQLDGAGPDGAVRCSYDRRGRLTAAETPAGRTRYAYDALGRRTLKTLPDRSTVAFAWAGELLVEETIRRAGETRRRSYLYLPDTPIPLAMRDGGTLYALHHGARGEIVAMTDPDGRVVWRADYDAFGRATVRVSEVGQPWRLPGQYHDAETGLHHSLARVYDPSLGRYLTADPLRDEGGSPNLYTLCDGDPANRSDPTGAFVFTAIVVGAAIGAAVGAGIEAYRQKKAIEAGEKEGYDGWGIAKAAGIGGAVGAIGGGAGAALEAGAAGVLGATAATTMAGGAAVGAAGGAGGSVVEQCVEARLRGDEIDPWSVARQAATDGLIGGGIGAVTGGAGGFLARRARKGVTAGVEAASASRRVPRPPGEAANRTRHEAFKARLRRQMEKPHVTDPRLKKLVDPLYRPNAKVGSGSTADAIRHERATGEAVGGRLHSQKGEDTVRALQKWLDNNPQASPGDRAAAENVIADMKDALGQ